jgi:hypothetical protein
MIRFLRDWMLSQRFDDGATTDGDESGMSRVHLALSHPLSRPRARLPEQSRRLLMERLDAMPRPRGPRHRWIVGSAWPAYISPVTRLTFASALVLGGVVIFLSATGGDGKAFLAVSQRISAWWSEVPGVMPRETTVATSEPGGHLGGPPSAAAVDEAARLRADTARAAQHLLSRFPFSSGPAGDPNAP